MHQTNSSRHSVETNRVLATVFHGAFTDEDIVDMDVTMKTSVADACTTDVMGRAAEGQAIISAGDGAAFEKHRPGADHDN